MKIKNLAYFIMAAVLTASMSSCNSNSQGEPWDSILKEYSAKPEVGQILLVKYKGGSLADAELYVKEGRRWNLVDSCEAEVGRDGIGKEREGDMKTPTGEMGIGTAFGIKPNPGTSLPYILATDSIYGCEDEEYYNQMIDTSVVHHVCTGEHIIDCVPAYNYGLTTTYNSECIFGKGSNIYIHCKSSKPYTSGCVALDEPVMVHLLQVAGPGLVVSVH